MPDSSSQSSAWHEESLELAITTNARLDNREELCDTWGIWQAFKRDTDALTATTALTPLIPLEQPWQYFGLF